MAELTPKPSTRRASRLEIAGKLTALIGLPLAILVSIFSGGVYLGATRSYRIQTLEHELLGMRPPANAPAEPAGPAPETPEPETPESPAADTGATPEQPQPETPEQPQPETPEQPQPETPEQPQPETPEQPQPETPEQPQPETPEPSAHSALPLVATAPVGPELRSRFDEELSLRVKVLVDPALILAREDWLFYTASLLAASDASFEALFGISIELHGIVAWDIEAGASADALLQELVGHDREGAELIIGLVAREQPKRFAGPTWTADQNGDHALVFADPDAGDRYYRPLLRALAGLFGAEPLAPGSPDAAGFMSALAPAPGQAPTLDPENRGRVTINKRRALAQPAGNDAEEI